MAQLVYFVSLNKTPQAIIPKKDNGFFYENNNKERKVPLSSPQKGLLSVTIANQESQITIEPNHSTKNQELRHLISYNTTIRSILKGQNQKKTGH